MPHTGRSAQGGRREWRPEDRLAPAHSASGTGLPGSSPAPGLLSVCCSWRSERLVPQESEEWPAESGSDRESSAVCCFLSCVITAAAWRSHRPPLPASPEAGGQAQRGRGLVQGHTASVWRAGPNASLPATSPRLSAGWRWVAGSWGAGWQSSLCPREGRRLGSRKASPLGVVSPTSGGAADVLLPHRPCSSVLYTRWAWGHLPRGRGQLHSSCVGTPGKAGLRDRVAVGAGV